MWGQVLVIGATGSVGSELVKQLGRKGERVRAATREPATRRSPEAGCEFVEFDFERPETFAVTLDGVNRVFLIARPGDDHADRVAFPSCGQGLHAPGTQALDHHEIARTISGAAGKAIQHVAITAEAAQGSLAAAGLSPERVDWLIAKDHASCWT